MRQRRHGDPHATHPAGRPHKPRTSEAELAAENAALRRQLADCAAEIAALKRRTGFDALRGALDRKEKQRVAEARRNAELTNKIIQLKNDNTVLRKKLANDPGMIADLEWKLARLRRGKGAVIAKLAGCPSRLIGKRSPRSQRVEIS